MRSEGSRVHDIAWSPELRSGPQPLKELSALHRPLASER